MLVTIRMTIWPIVEWGCRMQYSMVSYMMISGSCMRCVGVRIRVTTFLFLIYFLASRVSVSC